MSPAVAVGACFGLLAASLVACDDGAADGMQDTSDGGQADTELDGMSELDTLAQAPAVRLIDHAMWTAADASDDPFTMHRPAVVTCPDDGWYVDLGLLEVDTGKCNYVSVQQPLVEAVTVGEVIEVSAWHGQLLSPDASSGHMAVALGDLVIWEATVPIPSGSGFFVEQWTATEPIPAGTPIRFHLHNHGANTWNLESVRKRPPGSENPSFPTID